MDSLQSVLEAITRLEADGVVMHVGEKPYVVTASSPLKECRGPLAWGEEELSSEVITFDGLLNLLADVLPADQRRILDEVGAVEFALPSPEPSDPELRLVAARGGDDLWVEIRRRRAIPEREIDQQSDGREQTPGHSSIALGMPDARYAGAASLVDAEAGLPPAAAASSAHDPGPQQPPVSIPQDGDGANLDYVLEPDSRAAAELQALADALHLEAEPDSWAAEAPPETSTATADQTSAPPQVNQVQVSGSSATDASTRTAEEPVPMPENEDAPPTAPDIPASFPATELPRPAPLSLVPPVIEEPPAPSSRNGNALERILSAAAARSASVVYMVAQSRPMLRVDDEINPLEGESVLDAAEIDDLRSKLADAAPPDRGSSDAAESIVDVPGVGRVRYLTFHDHRGPGVLFRLVPSRALSAEHLGLTPEILALGAERDGLVLVTGGPRSGKSTLLAAFLEAINRDRSDYIITIESKVRNVHESRRSFVSQREVRYGSDAVAAAARRALLEEPDVLFLEDISSPQIFEVALDAAADGRLAFGSLQAASAAAALDQILEMFPPDRRAHVRSALAGALRGVIAQLLLRRTRGGRVAAREVLLNSPAVANLIRDGRTGQLAAALESRRHGMISLSDSLTTLARGGVVEVTEAYRKAPDRDALLAALTREGLDTSFAERFGS